MPSRWDGCGQRNWFGIWRDPSLQPQRPAERRHVGPDHRIAHAGGGPVLHLLEEHLHLLATIPALHRRARRPMPKRRNRGVEPLAVVAVDEFGDHRLAIGIRQLRAHLAGTRLGGVGWMLPDPVADNAAGVLLQCVTQPISTLE